MDMSREREARAAGTADRQIANKRGAVARRGRSRRETGDKYGQFGWG